MRHYSQGPYVIPASVTVGAKIKFRSEKRPYTVQACGPRYAVCTKPFNLYRGAVLYSIVDFDHGVRGTEDLIFGYAFNTRELCQQALDRLKRGDSEVSHRNSVELDIETITPVDKT